MFNAQGVDMGVRRERGVEGFLLSRRQRSHGSAQALSAEGHKFTATIEPSLAETLVAFLEKINLQVLYDASTS